MPRRSQRPAGFFFPGPTRLAGLFGTQRAVTRGVVLALECSLMVTGAAPATHNPPGDTFPLDRRQQTTPATIAVSLDAHCLFLRPPNIVSGMA
jgi:hypothetical protein